MDTTALQNENSYFKEQLEKANASIQRLETVEKTNLELIQKVSQLEESVTILRQLIEMTVVFTLFISSPKKRQKTQAIWSRK